MLIVDWLLENFLVFLLAMIFVSVIIRIERILYRIIPRIARTIYFCLLTIHEEFVGENSGK